MQNMIGILLVLYESNICELQLLKDWLWGQSFKNFKLYIINNSHNSFLFKHNIWENFNYYFEESKGNIGFAKANNLLAQKAIHEGCKYLLVLNPDMELADNALEEFISIMKKGSDIGICSSTILFGKEDKNKEIIQLFGGESNFITQKKIQYYSNQKLNKVELPDLLRVTYLSGGALFLSAEMVKKIGLFEEKYYMYNDEIDLFRRATKAGYSIVVTSKTKIWHHHDWSKKNISGYKFMYYYMMRNRVLYFKKFKLYTYLVYDLFLQFITFPLKIKMFYRIGSLSILKYYYLGLIRGLLGETGRSSIQFK